MIVTPEIIAELIYAISELRYFERECVMNPNPEAHDIVIKIQHKTDQLLAKMGMIDHISLEELKQITKIVFDGRNPTRTTEQINSVI